MTYKLYKAQDMLLHAILPKREQLGIPGTILAGGTALARCYLRHRTSYDLDFFVPNRFSPERLSIELGKIGVLLEDVNAQSDGQWANQLHAYAPVDDQLIKVSFVEDLYGDMWPHQLIDGIETEEIGGLYHRKLRTISGTGFGAEAKGARQTARDLFDVYVLNEQVQNIHSFVEHANTNGANFPIDAFSANLLAMPWIDLMTEFEGLELLDPYKKLSWIGDIKPVLVRQALALQHINSESHD